jgi:photosystem II stability/assembly factor-like uncharacterized protein
MWVVYSNNGFSLTTWARAVNPAAGGWAALGAPFTTDNPNSPKAIFGVSSTKWFVFANASGIRRLYTSNDNASTWTTAVSDVPTSYSFTYSGGTGASFAAGVNGSTVMICGKSTANVGAVLRSTDGGSTWAKVDVGGAELQRISYGGGRWVATDASNVYTSTNDGATWSAGPAIPAAVAGLSDIRWVEAASSFALSGYAPTPNGVLIYLSN